MGIRRDPEMLHASCSHGSRQSSSITLSSFPFSSVGAICDICELFSRLLWGDPSAFLQDRFQPLTISFVRQNILEMLLVLLRRQQASVHTIGLSGKLADPAVEPHVWYVKLRVRRPKRLLELAIHRLDQAVAFFPEKMTVAVVDLVHVGIEFMLLFVVAPLHTPDVGPVR